MSSPQTPSLSPPQAPLYPYVVKATAADGSEIRKFADERVASAIDAAITSANLQPGQSTAIIVTYKDPTSGPGLGTIRGAVMFRKEMSLLGKRVDWSLVGTLSHDFSTGTNRKEAGMVIRL
jgi:hypothetical protein